MFGGFSTVKDHFDPFWGFYSRFCGLDADLFSHADGFT